MLSDQRGDRWRRATFSPEAPAATLGGAVSQVETSDAQTGLWPLCSALRDPVSREQGSPWVNKGQGARGRGQQEEAKSSSSASPSRARAGSEQEAWLLSMAVPALEPCGRTQ